MTNEPSNEPISDLPSDSEIESILQDLQSSDTTVRRYRIQALREQNVADERIIEALKTLASSDPAGSVRKDAKKTLKSMGIEPPPLSPELAKKRRDFWMGVGLFFGLNIVLWIFQIAFYWLITTLDADLMYSDAIGVVGLMLGLLPWLVNIGLIIFLAFKRPQMALGMLAGFGMALLLVVCLLALWIGYCFVTGNVI